MHEELIERLTNAAARDWTLPHDKLCIHEAIAALSQPSGDSGQLAGWQLVPVEPTTGMVCNAVGELTSEQARRVYKAMLAAAPPPPVAAPSGWRPIESAPKDGLSIILLYNSTFNETFMGLRPTDCPDDAACDDIGTACYPTHWMPLPAPPEKSP